MPSIAFAPDALKKDPETAETTLYIKKYDKHFIKGSKHIAQTPNIPKTPTPVLTTPIPASNVSVESAIMLPTIGTALLITVLAVFTAKTSPLEETMPESDIYPVKIIIITLRNVTMHHLSKSHSLINTVDSHTTPAEYITA